MNKKYARIDGGGVVLEIFETDGDITQMFHASLVWVPCGAEVAAGWLFADGVFSAPPGLSPEATQAALIAGIQRRLDVFARTRGYDSMLSACSYATSAAPNFQAEGLACVALRDATWLAAHAVLADVGVGVREMPASISDMEADLPELAWPSSE